MALFTPSESPAVVVKEVDLTGGVPNVQTSTGAYVGKFMWGPADQRTLVANEEELTETFGSPDNSHSIDYHDAATFLKYSNALQLLRVADSSALNSVSTTGRRTVAKGNYAVGNYSVPTVKNPTAFDAQESSLDSDGFTFIGRFPGDLGNSLQVSMCPPSLNDSAFNGWTYKAQFDAAPTLSDFAAENDGTNDEVHVVVVDKNGGFTGTKGTVLETYPFLSVATNAVDLADGSNLFVKDVINTRSEYIHMVGFDSDFKNTGNAGTAITPGTTKDFLGTAVVTSAVKDFNFDSGANSGTLSASQYLL